MIHLYSHCFPQIANQYGWKLSGWPEGEIHEGFNNSARLIRLPGGEWHITGDKLSGHQLAYVQFQGSDDLVALAVWADAVHRDGGTPYAIFPYLPGARQDRRQVGEALSSVLYARMINACGLRQVVCLDPHSDVMPSHIDNLTIVPAEDVCAMVLALNPQEKIVGVIIPDAGAVKRATKMASVLKVPHYQALKHRDMSTGKLSGFTCEPLPAIDGPGRFLIVDDICDGGGTFKGLAKALARGKEQLALYVSHGIFSNGAEGLGEYFSAIYTTDSHDGSAQYNSLVRARTGMNKEFILPIFDYLSSFIQLR